MQRVVRRARDSAVRRIGFMVDWLGVFCGSYYCCVEVAGDDDVGRYGAPSPDWTCSVPEVAVNC